MNKSRNVLLICAIIFFLILGYIAYDFSRKTTFPGSNRAQPADSTTIDSLQIQD